MLAGLFFPTSPAALILAAIALVDVLGATLRDVEATSVDSAVVIRGRYRWVLLTILNIAQVVLAFAVLIRYCGSHFRPVVSDFLTAVYASAVTFMTLGYGDILPCAPTGRVVILAELCFFLFMLALKLPAAVSVMRVEVKK